MQAARDGKLIKEDEFQNLCVAWAQSTKAPVDQDKELTAANVGTPQEVGDFKTAMEEIFGEKSRPPCANCKVCHGRDPWIWATVRNLTFGNF